MLENKTEINLQAAMALQKVMMKRSNWLRYILAVILILNTGFQIVWSICNRTRIGSETLKQNSMVAFFCLILAILLLLMPCMMKKRVKRQLEQQLAMNRAPLVNHYLFQPDGLLVKDDGVENGQELLLPYEKITRFLQDETYYFLYVKSMNSAYILKQDAFIPNDNVQAMACLQEKLAHCKGIR